MGRPECWPDWLEHVWAKSSPRDGATGESLATHTWEVLSRLRDLAGLRPWLPEACGFHSLWNALFWSALFHDWGKAAAGFQCLLRTGKAWGHRHEVLSLAFLDWAEGALSESEALATVAAIVSHHRDADELERGYPCLPSLLEDDPISDLFRDLDESIVRGLWRWMAEVVPGWLHALGFEALGVRWCSPPDAETAVRHVLDDGPERVRSQLRRYRRLVRSIRDGVATVPDAFACIFLRGGILQADHVGSAHLGPLPRLAVGREDVLRAAGLRPDRLYDHQREAGETAGSALLVAPTGSGKTEAALLWAAAQDAGPRLPRLFYTLPYQASMNAMYDRLARIFPGQVGLVHSRSVLTLYQRFMDQDYAPEEAARMARLVRTMADLHYHPVRVFSPYQLLKAIYQLKGYEAMLCDLAGGAFVFDEIHAYEPERLAMILETMRFLRERCAARFFVMSATLPSLVRERLEDALGSPPCVSASPDLFRSFGRHRLHRLAGDLLSEEGLNRVLDAFRCRNAVLVVCNTVSRAQECYRRLAAAVPEGDRVLIHGRFNGRDRLRKEGQVLEATAPASPYRRPVVVVATQVVEVSLNIDLDTLFSDPAPLEALIQRFGRVNRSRRRDLAPVYVFTEPADGQGVYLPELVAGALEWVREQDGRPVDEGSVQSWLDGIYAGSVRRAWSERYEKSAADFRTAFLANVRPFASGAELEESFARLFDSTEILPACLEGEYLRMREERPVEASRLLVSLSWGGWHGARKEGKVRSAPGRWPPVVDLPYSPELGLGSLEGRPLIERGGTA